VYLHHRNETNQSYIRTSTNRMEKPQRRKKENGHESVISEKSQNKLFSGLDVLADGERNMPHGWCISHDKTPSYKCSAVPGADDAGYIAVICHGI